MIIKNITKEAAIYFKAEQEVLSEAVLLCNCDNPGYKVECLTCSCYLDIIKNIQAKIYGLPEIDCIIPCQEKFIVKEKDEPYPAYKKEECIKLYQEIGNAAKVARLLKVSEFVTYQWLHEKKLLKNNFYTTEFKENVVKIYYEVNSYSKASDLTGIKIGTIKHWVLKLRKTGTLESKRIITPLETQQKIVECYQSVNNTREVAKLCGVNRKTVLKFLRQAGILKKV